MMREMFGKFIRKKKRPRTYLDYAAATPVRPEVVTAMRPYLTEQFGNPSAIHNEGRVAAEAIAEARQLIAKVLETQATNILFAASGSEANNLAIFGYVRHLLQTLPPEEVEVISTKIEHPSVSNVLLELERSGVVVKYVPVDQTGAIDCKALQELLSPRTRLVSFAYANSEVGAVQDVKRIARLIKKFNREEGTDIKIHLDAAQAPLWLPCQLPPLDIDLMSLDAGKFCGPKGVGMLIKRNTELQPLIVGGGQESGMRAGTENTAGIVGAAKALKWAQDDWQQRAEKVRLESVGLWQNLEEILPSATLNGPSPASSDRLPNNINISLPGSDTEYAVVVLDANGVAASTKSACSGAGGGESVVVREMTNDQQRATSTIRFSLGPDTHLLSGEGERIAQILRDHLDQMKQFDDKQN